MKPIAVLAFVLAGCVTSPKPPVNSFVKLTGDTPAQCRGLCQDMGLQLSAVIVVRSSAGCVCEVEPGAPNASVSGGAASAADAMVADEEEEQASRTRRDRERRERERDSPPPTPHR
jgi:hypothetical protein